jgi:glycosyltransferase involved in cell wall biosynthesis
MAPAKTRSVQNLVENTPGYRHLIYSLNRVSGRADIASLDFGPDRVAVAYGAPSRGLFLRTFLVRVADWIQKDLERRGLDYDIIHAHKFTVEGLIALRLLSKQPRPFVCDIWGDTDLRITGARPDLGPQWRQISHSAAGIMPCAPWAEEKFVRISGLDRSRSTVLPPIIVHDNFLAPIVYGRPRFVTLFNLNVYRRKNVRRLVEAIVKLSQVMPGITLDIWGSGPPRAVAEIQQIIREAGAADFVTLCGPLAPPRFVPALNGYTGFLMPTLRETFGMVFIEAVFCGLPILYSRDWGVDGYFQPGDVGYCCDPRSLDDICAGIRFLSDNEAALKGNLVAMHEAGKLDRFKKDEIVATYQRILEAALATEA